MSTERKHLLLVGIFVMALVLANTLGAKIAEFSVPTWIALPLDVIFYPIIWLASQVLTWTGNDPLPFKFFDTVRVSVGILTVPLMFLVVDIVHECFGKKASKDMIHVGVVAMLLMIGITLISVVLPPAERFAEQNPAYVSFFSTSVRMAIASILAFYISQMNDIFVFHFFKRVTKGRFYWIRKNLSTFIGELLDSTIFMFVAFYHPETFPAQLVVKLIIPYWIFKMLFAVLDTPFSYLGIWWVGRKAKINE